MSSSHILDELSAAQYAISSASERILSLAETGLAAGPDTDLSGLFTEILDACAFDDLAGQRLARIAAWLKGTVDMRPDAGLINGPTEDGLAQAQVDALLFVETRRAGED